MEICRLIIQGVQTKSTLLCLLRIQLKGVLFPDTLYIIKKITA